MKNQVEAFVASVLALLISGLAVAQDRAPLVCSTTAVKTRVVPGEWVILRYSVRNPGTAPVFLAGEAPWGVVRIWKRVGGGEWRSSVGWLPDDVIPVGDPKFYEFKPGEEHTEMRLVMQGMEDTLGVHGVQVRIQYYRWPYPVKPPAGAWGGILECTPAQIEVVEPTGVDAEAFKALGPFPLSSDKVALARSYPTSSYTGYAFLGSFGAVGVIPVEAVLGRESGARRLATCRESDRPHVERSIRRLREDAEVMLSALDAFLGAHPDFPLAPRLRAKKAGLLAYFERYEEARVLAKKALAEEENPRWHKEGRRFLDLLVEKGYLKPE